MLMTTATRAITLVGFLTITSIGFGRTLVERPDIGFINATEEGSVQPISANTPVYLISTFDGSKQDGLHFAYSLDGYHWKRVPGLFLRAEVGNKIMRDPSICQGPDGVWHLVWTTGWSGTNGIGYAHSKDLVHWSPQKYIPVMDHEPNVCNVWAPELFYDDQGKQFIICWASTIPGRFPDYLESAENNHRMYCTTTRDFKTFTPTQLFMEPDFSVIDCYLLKEAGRYVVLLKDNSRPNRNLRVAFGDTPLGPWQNMSPTLTTQFTEGPSALKIGEDWLIYYEHYREKQYRALKTRDFKTFTNVTSEMTFPKELKHGTVFTATQKDLDRLLTFSQRKGTPQAQVSTPSSEDLAVSQEQSKRVPAFPGAEGFGAYAKGGRGGQILHVTTLADKGPGSLRWAVDQEGPRTIVFDVSGTIELESGLSIKHPFVTIAGQTAPGDGICLKGATLGIGTHDVIVRYLRCRLGDQGRGGDAISIGKGEDIIVDHCSASWSTDEILSTSTGKPTLTRVTVQWCFITEALNPKGHGFGSLIRGTGGAKYSYLHNLYAHNRGRNPRPGNYDTNPQDKDPQGLLLDFRNNVIYNWGGGHAGYNADSKSVTRLNYIGNYLIPGENSEPGSVAYSTGSTYNQAYFAGNYFDDKLPDNPWSLVKFSENYPWNGDFRYGWTDEKKQAYMRTEPFETGLVQLEDAPTAYRRVLESGGASLPKRDAVDNRIVIDIKKRTGKIINSQNEVGGWPKLKSRPAPTDSDGDGMPDAWEIRYGLDPNNAADGTQDKDGDGYTNVEEYLNRTAPTVFIDYRQPENNINILQSGLSAPVANSPNGFVVWSEGDHENRELKYMEIKKGVGPMESTKKTVCEKGPYADIECVISMDGKWVAFARELKHFDGRYDPPGDYHNFGNYDVYIVQLDGDLPAKPIRIGHGYWPSWGDDSDKDTKTLYYSYAEPYDTIAANGHDNIIRKTTISADGSFTEPVQHAIAPVRVKGPGAHLQCSPNGRYVAFRPKGIQVYDVQEDKIVSGAGGIGCHPCWGPNSEYLIWARNELGRIENGVGQALGSAGLSDYYYGISNDVKWVIGRIGAIENDQNTPHDIIYYPIDTSNGGWMLGEGIRVGSGTWCDIHVY